jgi:hypothetical protein
MGSRAWLIATIAACSFVAHGQQANPKLADVLAHVSDVMGPAPAGYTTPFVVVAVMPTVGEDRACSLTVVTNGMLYDLSGPNDMWCRHLPALHGLVWGRVRHSAVRQFLRDSGTASTASEYVDIAYTKGAGKPKSQAYEIVTAQAIDVNWGQ